jgi:hypothetical protein
VIVQYKTAITFYQRSTAAACLKTISVEIRYNLVSRCFPFSGVFGFALYYLKHFSRFLKAGN